MSPANTKKLIFVLLSIAIGVGGYFLVRRAFPSKYSPEAFREFMDTRTIGLAYMENLQTDEADQAWVELAAKLPEQLMPIRNLAITRLLSLDLEEEAKEAAGAPSENETSPQTKRAVDLEPVRQAFERMVNFEQQSAPALWLYARLIMHSRISPQSAARDLKAQELLTRATQQQPDDVRYWYEIFEIGRQSIDDQAREAGYAALQKAWELQPNNISLLINRLLIQSEQQAPEIEDTLKSAHETLGPLEAIVKRGSRSSVSAILEQIENALAAKEWKKVHQYARLLHNVVHLEEVAKWDLSILSAHPLDFAVVDFDESFYRRQPAVAASTKEPQIEVVFRAAKSAFPAEFTSCRDMEIVDFDLDGKLELVLLTDDQFAVLQSNGDQWETLVTVALPTGMRGMLLADLDRDRPITSLDGPTTTAQLMSKEPTASAAALAVKSDAEPLQVEQDQPPPRKVCHQADLDLVVYGDAGILVFRNQSTPESCALERVEQPEPLGDVTDVVCAAMADIDHDADVDLVFATKSTGLHVWSLAGASLLYDDLTQWTRGPPSEVEIAALTIVDWDRDTDIDLLASDASGDSFGLLENLRHGRFAWRDFGADPAWKSTKGGRFLATTDNDENLSWDVVAGGASGLRLITTTADSANIASLKAVKEIDAASFTGFKVLDFDNDSNVDVMAWSASKETGALKFFRGNATSLVFDATIAAEVNDLLTSGITACAVGDLDHDGDLDCIVATSQGLVELLNDGGNKNHWMDIQAMGRDDNKGRANHTGIGSLIEVKAGDRYLTRTVTGQITHIGLGQTKEPSLLRIIWTNGVPQAVVKPTANLTLCEPMVLKGSCPYLYTWTGEGFEFSTDCLWAAPIGLQFADGVIAPSRPWEYLKIDGESLQERNGKYVIQITEELWEAAYFDQVSLLAVDHPADIDVYSNEKVGPPSIAEFKIHTVSKPRRPLAAVDQRGRDILPLLAQADERCVKAFDHQHWQGLTEPHYIELDLGELDSPKKITLFLTGWIYPSDTSLNVGFSQDSNLQGPQMPSLWTPDAQGQWTPVQPYMGFPGGKMKTIAVDLSGAFAAKDYRVRIATTAEIYWDDAFFTVDDPSAPLETTTLQPVAADLHYRGFSARRWVRPNAPDQFDYDIVRTHPIWPPMQGRFTRYGDVAPLLQASDDHLVVMGSGDEMTVEFDAPPPPRQGWKRDFILHSVGWDKDADLNTFYGQSSEPLPFQAMQSYPLNPGEQPPDSPEYNEYLRTYQTRRQSRAKFWNWVKRM